MRKKQGRVVFSKGLWGVVATLILLLVQGLTEAAVVTEFNSSSVQVLNPFSLRLVTVRQSIDVSAASLRSPRVIQRANALSRRSLSFKATQLTVPGDVGKTLLFRNSAIRVPPVISVRSPSQPG